MDVDLCIADTLLELVDEPGNSSRRTFRAGTAEITVPPQDPETNAALLQLAHTAATRIVHNARDAFDDGAPSSDYYCPREHWAAPAGTGLYADRTLLEELLTLLERAVHVADDAASRMAAASSAVSDSFLAHPEPGRRSMMMWAPLASRGAAGHLYVGGAHDIGGLPRVRERDGFFSLPRLSSGGLAALEILRTLAPNPARIVDEAVSLDELVRGSGAQDPEALMYRMQRYANTSIVSPDEFYERAGADPTEFEEAREYLSQEIIAFDRPTDPPSGARPAQGMPPETLPDGSQSTFTIYAATRVPPTRHPDVYWSAVLRYDPAVYRLELPLTPPQLVYPTLSAPPPWLRLAPQDSERHEPGSTYGAVHTASAYSTVDGILLPDLNAGGRAQSWVRAEAYTFARHLLDTLLTDPESANEPLRTTIIEARMAAGNLAQTHLRQFPISGSSGSDHLG